jgi:hypothetical protein
MNVCESSLVMRKGTRRSCREGLIVSLGLSCCFAGAVVLSDVVVTVLVTSGLCCQISVSGRSLFVSLNYLSQACSTHGFRVEDEHSDIFTSFLNIG